MRSAFGRDFDVPDGYLDSATVGVPPQTGAACVLDIVERWSRGALIAREFDAAVAQARAGFADVVGVPVSAVATGGSASALVGLVAAATPDRARVLVADRDFTSLTAPFAAQAGRGVEVVQVPLGDLVQRAGHLGSDDVVAVSAVQSADGARVDLPALRAATAASGARVVLDVTQSAGWLDADTSWADAVIAGGYKWLMSPRGIAWMAVSPRLMDVMVPHAANWSAADDPWGSVYGLPIRLSATARRFDTSPAWFCHLGAAQVLPWLATLDRAAVHAHAAGLADALRAELGMPAAGSAIVALDRPDAAERLEHAGVRAAVRDGRARLAFALFNTTDDLDRVVSALI